MKLLIGLVENELPGPSPLPPGAGGRIKCSDTKQQCRRGFS